MVYKEKNNIGKKEAIMDKYRALMITKEKKFSIE